jgi:cytochrome c
MGGLMGKRIPGLPCLIGALALPAFFILPLPARSDDAVGSGRTVFQTKCAMCHTFLQGAGHSTGPNLFGLMGRHIGTAKGFHYSEAMEQRKNEVWNQERLDQFVTQPQKFMPRTAMMFVGISDPSQRSQLLEFLGSLKNSD